MEAALDSILATPDPDLVAMMKRLDGDVIILGATGKIGLSLASLAVNAVRESRVPRTVYGVSRFTDPSAWDKLESCGAVPLQADLLDAGAVETLPRARNVLLLAGRKFGTEGGEALTWATNTVVPARVAEHFHASRIVAFSTGCVYPLRSADEGGCSEEVPPDPIGEYSQSCLGRERVLEHYAREYGTELLLFRLNYANDLRYGVLHDIGRAVWEGRAVDNAVSHFNVIWQGDANACALRAFELAQSPPGVLNVTGLDMVGVEEAALDMGRLMGREVFFTGEPGDRCYLSDASKMARLLGRPKMPLDDMIRLQAQWIMNGGVSIGKPTHFEVSNGRF
jgi:nucleoside-diphosphate-sugar epimerase